MSTVAALVPVVMTMVLLLRYRAHFVAPLVLATGTVLAVLVFHASTSTVLHSFAHALPVTIEVLLIVLGGLWFSTALAAAGANDAVSGWISEVGLSSDRLVVLIVLGVTPFAEAVTGFGVGAVIAVPVLLAIGLPPVKAAICGLLGFVAVPWGALGPGTLVGAQIGQVDFLQLGLASAMLSLPVFVICGLSALGVAAGARRARRRTLDVTGVSLLLWLAIWGANYIFGTQLAGAIGSAITIAVYLVLAARIEGVKVEYPKRLRTYLSPYAVLCVLVCMGRVIQVAFLPDSAPELVSRAVAGPALWLIVTCLALRVILRKVPVPRHLATTCFPRAVRKWIPVAITTTGFLLLGSLMTFSGISAELAEAGARLGAGYLLVSPVIGAIGGFLTGSNSGANAMFAGSQAYTAHALGVNPTMMVALNNVTGSMATMASSPRVAMAVSLVATVPAGHPVTKLSAAANDRAGSGSNERADNVGMEREVFRTTLAVVAINVAVYAVGGLLVPVL